MRSVKIDPLEGTVYRGWDRVQEPPTDSRKVVPGIWQGEPLPGSGELKTRTDAERSPASEYPQMQ